MVIAKKIIPDNVHGKYPKQFYEEFYESFYSLMRFRTMSHRALFLHIWFQVTCSSYTLNNTCGKFLQTLCAPTTVRGQSLFWKGKYLKLYNFLRQENDFEKYYDYVELIMIHCILSTPGNII